MLFAGVELHASRMCVYRAVSHISLLCIIPALQAHANAPTSRCAATKALQTVISRGRGWAPLRDMCCAFLHGPALTEITLLVTL